VGKDMITNMARMKAITQPLPLAKLSYEKIRSSILNGNLKAGEVYNEIKLAKELGISRTPVREALLELSVQGLVTFLPRRGIMVNYFTKRDLEEAFEFRKAIELAVMDKIIKHLDNLNLKNIEKAINAQQKAAENGDRMAFLAADRLFHTTFAKLAGNQRMVIALENLRDIIHLMGFEALARSGRMHEVLDEHREVLELIRKGQGEEARKAMADHLHRSMNTALNQHEFLSAKAKADP
jgi:DNA-binding GntR family transcriptional regulator